MLSLRYGTIYYRAVTSSNSNKRPDFRPTTRQMNSALKGSLHEENFHSNAVQKAFISLKKTSNIDGTIIGYPGIEAIFDGFGIIHDCIERFEISQCQTL